MENRPVYDLLLEIRDNLKALFEAYAEDREQHRDDMAEMKNDLHAMVMELDLMQMDRPLNIEIASDGGPVPAPYIPPKKRAAKTRKAK